MKVKIGSKIYSSSVEPICIILEDDDKRNIENMDVTCTKYCSYPGEGYSPEQIEEFMKNDRLPD